MSTSRSSFLVISLCFGIPADPQLGPAGTAPEVTDDDGVVWVARGRVLKERATHRNLIWEIFELEAELTAIEKKREAEVQELCQVVVATSTARNPSRSPAHVAASASCRGFGDMPDTVACWCCVRLSPIWTRTPPRSKN